MHFHTLSSTSLWNLTLLAALTMVRAAPWSEDPFGPPSYPLAVRSPYLSCWLPQGNATALNAAWPTFWGGSVGLYPLKVESGK